MHRRPEAEKQAERLAEFERENAELKSAKTRSEIASSKGLTTELIAGPASNSEEDLESTQMRLSHGRATFSRRS